MREASDSQPLCCCCCSSGGGLKNNKRKREPEEEGPSKKVKYSDSVVVISSSEKDTTPEVTRIPTKASSRKRTRKDQHDQKTSKKRVDEEVRLVSREVRLLQKLQNVPAVVKLLDWYDSPDQLILVLERPDPCEDLLDFVHHNNGILKECDAKIIAEQLVDALIQIHAHGVFHRDIKLQNILIETGSSIPRVRIIDFGCGTILSKCTYISGLGTYLYQSPEWAVMGRYQAEPATVWQVGVTLFRLVHESYPRIGGASDGTPCIVFDSQLSTDCRDFLHSCFIKNPLDRATLQGLQQHPWLTSRTPQPNGP
ncbi:uncharacterized protein V6R79_001395 [Siganus canaliculatus]